MRLSIVVPAFNSRDALQLMQPALARLLARSRDVVEIIIVDDGSADDTASVVAQMRELHYVFVPRTDTSCRSRARNIGLERATGDVVTFLDAGVLIAPDFAERVLERFRERRDLVLLHYVYGLFAAADAPEMAELKPLVDAGDIAGAVARVQHILGWLDMRRPYFDLAGGNLDELPGAWAFGFSAAFTVSRALALEVGGFDERFLKYGDEDIDFAYRLSTSGGALRAEDRAIGLHWPHAHDGPPGPDALRERRLLIHRRRYDFETELFLYYSNRYFQVMLSRYEHTAIAATVPLYSAELLDAIATPGKRSLVLGFDDAAVLARLAPSYIAVQSRRMQASLRAQLPGSEILYTLCTDTAFPAQHFDVAIVNDHFRQQSQAIQRAMLQELARIAREVVLVWTPTTSGLHTPVATWEGGRWSTLEALDAMLADVGLRRERVCETGAAHLAVPHVVFRLVPP
jgi:glycosyltransferase involved in cell wall biosynthesis